MVASRLWDMDHGKELSSYQCPTKGEVSACVFLDGRKDVLLGADSEGMVWMFEVGNSVPSCEPIACNSAAVHLCEHYEGTNAVQEVAPCFGQSLTLALKQNEVVPALD